MQSIKSQSTVLVLIIIIILTLILTSHPALTVAFTATPQPTGTLTPSNPDTRLFATATSVVALALNPVERNTDWTPQYQTFNGYEMALVPVGCFMMGSADGVDDEKPVNQQCFDQPFWIDRYAVTNQQYGSEGTFKGDNLPRDSVTWFEARDFCANRDAHLPTERQWEYAARGPSNLVYPWGNDFVADNVVYSSNSTNQTAAVGSRHTGDSWVGVSDLSGNVWEWVSSIYQPYPYNAADGREVNNDSADVLRGLRGGSWSGAVPYLSASGRLWVNPTLVSYYIGFRCVRFSGF